MPATPADVDAGVSFSFASSSAGSGPYRSASSASLTSTTFISSLLSISEGATPSMARYSASGFSSSESARAASVRHASLSSPFLTSVAVKVAGESIPSPPDASFAARRGLARGSSRAGNRTTSVCFFLLNLTLGAASPSHARGKGTIVSGVSRPDVVAITDNRRASASASTSAETSLARCTPGNDTVISSHRTAPSPSSTAPPSASVHRVAAAASTSSGAIPASAARKNRRTRVRLKARARVAPRATSSGDARHVTTTRVKNWRERQKNVVVRRIAPNNDVSLETT